MNIKTIKIAITLVDQSAPVAIMDFAIVGRGSNLSHGAHWTEEGWWEKEPTDENIQYQVDRAANSYLGPVKSWRIIDENEIPIDRTFREALKDDGEKLHHDMGQVRNLHLESLRRARTPLLEQKDKEWMRAMGQGNAEEAERVEAERQALRDLPETIADELEKAQTPDEVKTIGIDCKVKLCQQ